MLSGPILHVMINKTNTTKKNYLFEQPPGRWLGREQRSGDGLTSSSVATNVGNKRSIRQPH